MIKFTQKQIDVLTERNAEVKFVRKAGDETVFVEVWDKVLKTMTFEVGGVDHEEAVKAAVDKLAAMPKPKSVADALAEKDAEIERLKKALGARSSKAQQEPIPA